MSKQNRNYKLWVITTDNLEPLTFYGRKVKKESTELQKSAELKRMRAWIARNSDKILRAIIFDLKSNQAIENYTLGGVRL